MIKDKFINNPYFLWVEVVSSMSVKEVSLYFLGGVPIQNFGLTLSTPGLVLSNFVKDPDQV